MAVTASWQPEAVPLSAPSVNAFMMKSGVHTSRAHDTDNADIRRVLDTAATGEVRTGIGTPVAEDPKDLGF